MDYGHQGGILTASHLSPQAVDREQMLDRLQHLRGIVSAFAYEAASARNRAAGLRLQNRRLLEEVRRLQRERGAR